jgi:GntR family transcriptional regulator
MAAKYKVVAGELAERIRRREFAHRDRLPGELELAREFSVSRGTVRQALATLQQNGLIETWTGAGSFVTYDGERVDDAIGWSEALARTGVPTSLALVTTKLGPDLADFLAVERVRSTTDGVALTLERSRVPWRTSFEAVVATGLVDGSLQATLTAHGLVGVGGEETIGLAVLGSQDALLLRRAAGEAFLESERTTYDAFGDTALTLPAPLVQAVDTTGAGDTHTGVLLAALVGAHPLRTALARADLAAALSVTRSGSATATELAALRLWSGLPEGDIPA